MTSSGYEGSSGALGTGVDEPRTMDQGRGRTAPGLGPLELSMGSFMGSSSRFRALQPAYARRRRILQSPARASTTISTGWAPPAAAQPLPWNQASPSTGGSGMTSTVI